MRLGTVLAPLDGTMVGEAALPYAEAIARAMGAPLRLVSVVDVFAFDVPRGRMALVEELRTAQARKLVEYLELTAAVLRESGLVVSCTVQYGAPADEILALSRGDEIGMIVMATHGRGGVQRWWVGSVADKVMRMSVVPVLLVRPPTEAAARQSVSINRILVPLDGSELAEAALDPALALARAAHARVVLLRVEPWGAMAGAPELISYAGSTADIEREVTDALYTYLHGVKERLGDDVPVEIVAERGVPGQVLIDYAHRPDVDLVVMATHGRGGWRRFVLGSTADRMVRSGVPTLLIPPPAAREGAAAQATATRA